jgi:hypothetical protein
MGVSPELVLQAMLERKNYDGCGISGIMNNDTMLLITNEKPHFSRKVSLDQADPGKFMNYAEAHRS